jgi:hypothetical protein
VIARRLIMREIIFRGKDILMSWWLYGSLLINNGQYYIYCDKVPETHPEIFGFTKSASRIDPETFGQYTGLSTVKSYRGEKPEDLRIFEGDIVYSADWQKYAEIVLLDGCWAVSFGDNDVEALGDVYNEFEISGIAHDTPELQEQGEEG